MNHCHRYFLPFTKKRIVDWKQKCKFFIEMEIFIFYFLQTTRMYPDTFTACEFSNWMTVWQNASLLMYNFLFMHMEDFFTRVGLNECVFSPFISSHTHNKTQFEDAAPFNPTSLHNRNAWTHIFKGLVFSNVWGLLLWCKFRFILTNSKVVSWQRKFLLCVLHTSHKLSDFYKNTIHLAAFDTQHWACIIPKAWLLLLLL